MLAPKHIHAARRVLPDANKAISDISYVAPKVHYCCPQGNSDC